MCPGYGARLRWTNAIAVRGRYRGMLAPLPPPSSTSNSASKMPLHEGPSEWAEASKLLAQLIPHPPPESEVDILVKYYADRIAGNMVWLDSELNGYRQFVLPLSKSQPVLLLAILVVSAEHMATSQGSTSAFATRARDVVISRITQCLQQATSNGAKQGLIGEIMDIATAEWILASILILSTYECVGYTSKVWHYHRHGARTLINALPMDEGRSNELYIFLRYQFSMNDVFAATTNHIATASEDIVLPLRQDPEPMFAEYAKLIHQVTLHCRHRPSTTAQFMNLSDLRLRFELARASTLEEAGRVAMLNREVDQDFICLVDTYHHAGLLYAYQYAYRLPLPSPHVRIASEMLFERLGQFESLQRCVQNLPWPGFIAGLASYGLKEQQDVVSALYQMIIKETGYNNYNMVLSFLQTFWSGDEPEWTKAKQAWESDGNFLLPI